MSRAFKCERCGKFEEGIPATITSTKSQMLTVEICNMCFMAYKDWLDSPRPKEEVNNAK